MVNQLKLPLKQSKVWFSGYYVDANVAHWLNLVTDTSLKTEEFLKECITAKRFNHPNIMSLIGVSMIPEEGTPLMVLPYMHHGDVKSFVKSKRGSNIELKEFPEVYRVTKQDS